ncbi:hypothetical protein [Stutzerimonas zhaodongensis]|uniref:hypothetical protein n=1 Tax=Stutzerimonas zhaodongensis TaxID=1176257 RepID=UPI0021028613|nr:hypothetical protein [Stutzerimonas zhaodongensis]MCQ2030152.1 hypothetical protein [Stutzerimonas zhaodongensis]
MSLIWRHKFDKWLSRLLRRWSFGGKSHRACHDFLQQLPLLAMGESVGGHVATGVQARQASGDYRSGLNGI